jgi:hypothetical protein
MTLGVSGESVEIGRFDQSRINPKIGLRWNPIEDVQIRLSALLVVDQTLEPT